MLPMKAHLSQQEAPCGVWGASCTGVGGRSSSRCSIKGVPRWLPLVLGNPLLFQETRESREAADGLGNCKECAKGGSCKVRGEVLFVTLRQHCRRIFAEERSAIVAENKSAFARPARWVLVTVLGFGLASLFGLHSLEAAPLPYDSIDVYLVDECTIRADIQLAQGGPPVTSVRAHLLKGNEQVGSEEDWDLTPPDRGELLQYARAADGDGIYFVEVWFSYKNDRGEHYSLAQGYIDGTSC